MFVDTSKLAVEKLKEVKQMERLAERYKDSIANTVLIRECGDKLCKDICDDIECDCSKCELEKALEKLADYEDLEEQGLLVRLPCKEAYTQSGNYVYLIADCEIVKCVHCGLGIDPLSGTAYITLATDEKIFPYRNPDPEQDLDPTDWCTNATDVKASELGKTVFLTREEAEKRLEEIQNDKT